MTLSMSYALKQDNPQELNQILNQRDSNSECLSFLSTSAIRRKSANIKIL